MNWTVVRYRTKLERADENQRLSAAVFVELQAKSPSGVAYLVFRLPDDTFVHVAATADGAPPISSFEAFRAFRAGNEERCLEPPKAAQATLVGSYGFGALGGKTSG